MKRALIAIAIVAVLFPALVGLTTFLETKFGGNGKPIVANVSSDSKAAAHRFGDDRIH